MTNVISPSVANWNEQKVKLKAQFTFLTDEDLSYAEGKRDDMITGLQIKTGKTKDELAAIIAAL
jgi:uncharacterized protein YjbJ (UPF0337 family)